MASKFFSDLFNKIKKMAKNDGLPTSDQSPYIPKGNGINSNFFSAMNSKVAISLFWAFSSALCVYLSYYHCVNYSNSTTVRCDVSECSVVFKPNNIGRGFVFDTKDIVGADSVRIDESIGGND